MVEVINKLNDVYDEQGKKIKIGVPLLGILPEFQCFFFHFLFLNFRGRVTSLLMSYATFPCDVK